VTVTIDVPDGDWLTGQLAGMDGRLRVPSPQPSYEIREARRCGERLLLGKLDEGGVGCRVRDQCRLRNLPLLRRHMLGIEAPTGEAESRTVVSQAHRKARAI